MNKRTQKGFSLGEVLISVFILGISLTVAVIVVAKNIKVSIDSREAVVASQLAQEGAELVRNLRDLNWANDVGSFAARGFPAGDGTCRVDINSIALDCGSPFYTLSLFGNFYIHNNAATAKYRRQISIDYDTNNFSTANTAIVTSMVFWGTGAFPPKASCSVGGKCVFADLTLTKWGEY